MAAIDTDAAWWTDYRTKQAEQFATHAAGLALIIEAARAAQLPMPYTATATPERVSMQFWREDLPAWSEWCNEPIVVDAEWTDENEQHAIVMDLLDVPVELVSLVDRGPLHSGPTVRVPTQPGVGVA